MPKWARRSLRASLALVTACVVFALIGLPIYVFPPTDKIGKADLIYVIGPPVSARVAVERELRREGVAELSLYSVSLIGGLTSSLGVCRQENVICKHPEPYSTKGEAGYLQGFAAEHGVGRTIVITFTPHVARARYVFAKCYRGEVQVIGVDQHLDLWTWIYQYFYQTGAFIKAWATPCADGSD